MDHLSLNSGETPDVDSSPFGNALKGALITLASAALLGAAAAVGDIMAKTFQKKLRDFLVEKNLPPESAVRIIGDQVVVGSAQVGAEGYSSAPTRPPIQAGSTSHNNSYDNYRNIRLSQSDKLFSDWDNR